MEWIVPKESDGKRLDRFLRDIEPGLPATALFRLCRKKKILVNGRPVKELKQAVNAGDLVCVRDASAERKGGGGSAAKLPVLFEDLVLVVVDKPRGLSVHSGKGETARTVIGLLQAQFPECEPHLAHRLDKDTSGALVAAKDRATAGKLGGIFRKTGGQGARKRYLALAFGKARERGRIETPLDGQEAATRWRKLAEKAWSAGVISLLDIEIDTGRTHQIRRHLASIGLPVAGDEDYGDWDLNKAFGDAFRIRGAVLHALSISFPHPVSGTLMKFEAPLPREILVVFPDANSFVKGGTRDATKTPRHKGGKSRGK